jgi:hypothetical protein
MTKSVLAHFIDLGVEGGSGSWALSKNDYDLFFIAISSILSLIEEVINTQIIPQLIDWNFGTGKYPKFRIKRAEDNKRELMKEVYFRIATDESPNVSPEFVYELEKMISKELDLPLEYELTTKDVKYDPKMFTTSKYPEVVPVPGDSRGSRLLERNKVPTKNKAGAKQPKNQNVPKS